MATSKKVNKSEIKAAIAAIMNSKRPNIRQLRLDEGARLMALRGKLEKQLEPLFAETGLDVAKLNKMLAEHQSEVGSVLEQEKAKYAKAFALLNKDLRGGNRESKEGTRADCVQAPDNHANPVMDGL
jgi:hypothetical protein